MALTDEQRAMLQLLLEGGQGYEDIGSLLGIGTDEVRSRARAALREIAGADPDAQVGLSDYLLGQADPIGRADAVRHLQSDPETNALAARLIQQLRLLAPKAELPAIPEPRSGRRAAPSPPPSASPPAAAPTAPGSGSVAPPAARSASGRVSGALSGLGSMSRRQSQIVVGLGAGALLVLVAVLAIAGVFGGGDDGGSTTPTGTGTTASAEDLTIVPLAPLGGGSGASGQATFARAGDQPVLQLNLTGLPQAPSGQTYIVWLYNSDSIAFPLARDQADKDGNLTGAAAIPSAVVGLLPQFGCVDVSLASDAETAKALQAAVKGKSLPAHSGRTVLRGEIPRSAGGGAKSGAAAQCERQPAGAATTPNQ